MTPDALRVLLEPLEKKWRAEAKADAKYGVSQAMKSKREHYGCVNAALAKDDCANDLAALLKGLR